MALTACSRGTGQAEKEKSVRLGAVEVLTDQRTLQFPGKVVPADDATLSFRVGGTISRMCVQEGDRVRRGQLLALLDPTDYEAQLKATEAQHAQIQADARRIAALYAEGAATAQANDRARYALEQVEAQLSHHRDELSYTRLLAPMDGEVQTCFHEAHETVAAGMPVISLMGTTAPEVEINIPAQDYVRRSSFASFSCTFDVYPGRTFPLQFVSVTPRANANQLYTVRLRLAKPTDGKGPALGMNTMVTIRCAAAEADGGAASLVVPTSAVLGDNTVFLYDKGVLSKRSVEVVRLLGDGRSLVRSATLHAGDSIVTSGVHFVREGDRVRPLPPVSETNVGGLL